MSADCAACRPRTGGQPASTAGEDRECSHFSPDVLAHSWGDPGADNAWTSHRWRDGRHGFAQPLRCWLESDHDYQNQDEPRRSRGFDSITNDRCGRQARATCPLQNDLSASRHSQRKKYGKRYHEKGSNKGHELPFASHCPEFTRVRGWASILQVPRRVRSTDGGGKSR